MKGIDGLPHLKPFRLQLWLHPIGGGGSVATSIAMVPDFRTWIKRPRGGKAGLQLRPKNAYNRPYKKDKDAMKITDDPTPVKLVRLPENRAAEPCPKGPSPAHRKDRVSLSPQAKELLNAQRALAAIPDVRAEEVEKIKARIADGSYRIESDKIAAKMIRQALSEDD
jgi:negative regulator of flagellin synthesis FlgM